MPEAGVGAFRVPTAYRYGLPLPAGSDSPWHKKRVGWAVWGIQQELLRHGHMLPFPDSQRGTFGPKTKAGVTEFQGHAALTADGVAGAKTCKALFASQFAWWQHALGIPGNLLWAMHMLESNSDPGAEGSYDRDDRGISQYNRRYHPDLTDDIAYGRPAFCIQRAADDLTRAFKRFRDGGAGDSLAWMCAVASHNNPSKARRWALDGYPPDDQIDEYVRRVYSKSAAL